MQLNVFNILLIVSTLVSALLAFFTFRRRGATASLELFFILIAITIWSFFAFFEAISQTVFYKTLFSILSYTGVTAVPVLFLLFACRYVNADSWICRKNISYLFIIPAITMIVASTNHIHRLLWSEVSLGQNNLAGIYGIYGRGAWFWVHATYSYTLIFASLMVLIYGMMRFRHIYRLHSRLLILFSAFPLIANLIYIFSPEILEGVDLTPVMFTISGIFLFLAIFHYKLLEISPIAWETIIESLDNGLLIFNNNNLILEVNQRFVEYFNADKPRIGTHISIFFKSYPQISQSIIQGRLTKTEVSVIKNNKRYFFQLECSPIYSKQNIVAKTLLARDITRQKIDQQKIRLSEEKFRTLFENSIDGIFIATPQGKIIDANSSLASMLGYGSREEFVGANIMDMGPDDHNKCIIEGMREATLTKKDLSKIHVEISSKIIYEGPQAKLCQGIVRDITSRKKAEKQLKFLSFHDSLTGLYNRYYFEEEIKRINNGFKRFFPISIISMDINNLKTVNDNFGHKEGDKMLKETARILESLVRKEDILARIGGDEFCAILPRTPQKVALKRKEKLNKLIKKHNGENKLDISIAIGIAATNHDEQGINDALNRADNLMYVHKREMKENPGSSLLNETGPKGAGS